MSSWNSNLIDAYRVATSPYRLWQMQQRRRRGQVPVFSVFYHRVSDFNPNPWTISCRDFERQIDWMEENFNIVDLPEFQRRIASGFNTRPTLSITFDDGYAENCEFALPMLIERRIPVTYFVTVHHITHQQPFPHDVKQAQALSVNTIESLRALDMGGVEIGAHTRNHVDLGKLTDSEELIDEVITASNELGEQVGRAIRYFAFPFGQRQNLNEAAFQLLKKAGFLGACTTLGGWNEIGGDPFQISRLHGDPCFSRIRNWLRYDPRFAKVKQFEYDDGSEIPLTEQQKSTLFPAIPLPANTLSANSATPINLEPGN